MDSPECTTSLRAEAGAAAHRDRSNAAGRNRIVFMPASVVFGHVPHSLFNVLEADLGNQVKGIRESGELTQRVRERQRESAGCMAVHSSVRASIGDIRAAR